jgi:hypothetical protein
MQHGLREPAVATLPFQCEEEPCERPREREGRACTCGCGMGPGAGSGSSVVAVFAAPASLAWHGELVGIAGR